jgi:hypothetical protein
MARQTARSGAGARRTGPLAADESPAEAAEEGAGHEEEADEPESAGAPDAHAAAGLASPDEPEAVVPRTLGEELAAAGLGDVLTSVRPDGALGHYIREEARGVLLLAGLTPFVAAIEEAGIADVLVLDRLSRGGLTSTDAAPFGKACRRLRNILRATTWAATTNNTGAELTRVLTNEAIVRLRAPLVAAAAGTNAARMGLLQRDASDAAARAAAATAAADHAAAAPALLAAATGAAAGAVSVEALAAALSTAVERLTSSRKRPADSLNLPAEPKVPSSRIVLEWCTTGVEQQLTTPLPTTVTPIEEDVHVAFQRLTANPPRAAALATLELPVGGMTRDAKVTRSKQFAHVRGTSRDAELTLLCSWLRTHAVAGAAPAGPQYVVNDLDTSLARQMRADSVVFAFCRPAHAAEVHEAAVAKEARDAASASGGGDTDSVATTEKERNPYEVDAVSIADVMQAELFGTHCRAEAELASLDAAASEKFVDAIIAAIHDHLYQNRRLFSAALDMVEPNVVAKRFSGAGGGSPSGGGRGSRLGGPLARAPAPAPASAPAPATAIPGICRAWASEAGCPDSADDCKWRHYLTKEERPGGSPRGGAKKQRERDRPRGKKK